MGSNNSSILKPRAVVCENQEFSSVSAFTNFYGLKYPRTVYLLSERKFTPEQCVGLEPSEFKSKYKKSKGVYFNGRQFKSRAEFSNFYGLNPTSVNNLMIIRGFTPEECLGLTYRKMDIRGQEWTYNDYFFTSRREFADYFGFDHKRVHCLMNNYKLTHEECLGLKHVDESRVPGVVDEKHIKNAEKERTTKKKKCSRCHVEKPTSEFSKRRKRYSQLNSCCKQCNSLTTIKSKYGLTRNQYYDMLKKQDNKCLMCGTEENPTYPFTKRKLHVDHDHNTGKVRGLLCSDCNVGLGNLKDNIEILQNAIKYLENVK